MGKRSTFPRRARDLYPTPAEAVTPLLRHLPTGVRFVEPCAGDGALVKALETAGHSCVFASDIAPQAAGIEPGDVMALDHGWGAEMFITNPPWPGRYLRGEPTLSVILHLSRFLPTWLLLPADFAHNKYFSRVKPICSAIVSVGRVSWIGNGTSGVDNAAWYLFDQNKADSITVFHGRAA